jgi:hypothetical protein
MLNASAPRARPHDAWHADTDFFADLRAHAFPLLVKSGLAYLD